MADSAKKANIINFQAFNNIASAEQFQYVKQALNFVSDFMTPEKYQHLYLSFNGGKDATIVLFLTLVALNNSAIKGKPIKCLYFSEPNSFQQVNTFIQYMRSCNYSLTKELSLQWIELQTKNYSKQLTKLVEQRALKYIVMGTRKGDPHCQNLGRLAPSDINKGYPDFLRVNPIFEWSYEQVWAFIKGFKLPYCSLYDQGYTYLGNKTNTAKNNSLYDKQAKKYSPASEGHSQIEIKSRIVPTTKFNVQ